MIITYCDKCGDEIELPKVGQIAYFCYCARCNRFQHVQVREFRGDSDAEKENV